VAELVYTAITSLDGYVADRHGDFDWAAPDDEVHAFVNDCERPIGTYLMGRRMYEVMRVWDDPAIAGDSAVMQEYARIWQAAEKVVYSRSLDQATTARTRLERDFDHAAVAEIKAGEALDMSVSGPDLAAQALQAGLVDELRQFVHPVIVGGGTHWLPDDLHADLVLVDQHRFANGVVHLRYRLR
jgi:dihydrofolate reductase